MPLRVKRHHRAVFTDLGILKYKKVLDIQNKTLNIKIDQNSFDDQIFFVEHCPVFTLGKRGGQENLSVSKEFLNSKNIELVQTNRGGNITFHGPGQAVMYPIINLEKNNISVKDFVYGLEEIMKLTSNDFNINADRNKKNHGIWVGNSKLGSVGIAIKRGISMHGLALNINLDLKPFTWINPCGLSDISITSIEKEMYKNCNRDSKLKHHDYSMDKIKQNFVKYFSSVFNFQIVMGNKI